MKMERMKPRREEQERERMERKEQPVGRGQ
jgi:hypothetical protein